MQFYFFNPCLTHGRNGNLRYDSRFLMNQDIMADIKQKVIYYRRPHQVASALSNSGLIRGAEIQCPQTADRIS